MKSNVLITGFFCSNRKWISHLLSSLTTRLYFLASSKAFKNTNGVLSFNLKVSQAGVKHIKYSYLISLLLSTVSIEFLSPSMMVAPASATSTSIGSLFFSGRQYLNNVPDVNVGVQSALPVSFERPKASLLNATKRPNSYSDFLELSTPPANDSDIKFLLFSANLKK
ncbi:Uncharacterised protein [Shimwellia blattae]|nr:Uncharacterised protein [Shimwellia blattae]